MKKILISLSIIAVIAVVSIGITTAYFTDTEKSENNTMAAGTMDLNIDGGNTAVQTMSLSNKAPGDIGTEDSVLKNVGSLGGELDITIGTVNNLACKDVNPGDLTEYCDSTGTLGANAKMALYIDVDRDGIYDSGTEMGFKSDGSIYTSGILQYDTMDSYSGKGWNNVYSSLMMPTTKDDFVIDWEIPTGATNEIQGDAVNFDVTFTLRQASAPNSN